MPEKGRKKRKKSMPAKGKSKPMKSLIIQKGKSSLSKLKKAIVPKRNTVLLSSLSHASFITCFLIGPLSMAVPLVIWLQERKQPKPVASVEFHSRQAFFFQCAVYLLFLILGSAAALLMKILVGLLFIPFLILAFLSAVGYAVYGGVRVRNGRRFKYWFLTNFIEKRFNF